MTQKTMVKTPKQHIKRKYLPKQKLQLGFYKHLSKFIWGALLFLFILFFVILPVSEMQSGHINIWEVFQDRTGAFIQSIGTIGIAIGTIVISKALSWLYEFVKSYNPEE